MTEDYDEYTARTQRGDILRYLMENKTITTYEAVMDLGILKLSNRISELRRAGHNINDEWIHSTNKYGRHIKWKKYYLA